jgi:GTP-binding protein
MSKKEQEQVGRFIEEYLFNRKQISLIIFLVDIRHTPTNNDRLMYNYVISAGLPFIILTNKADKIAITKVDSAANNIQKELNPIGDIPTLPFSSERKIYKDEVWNILEKYI